MERRCQGGQGPPWSVVPGMYVYSQNKIIQKLHREVRVSFITQRESVVLPVSLNLRNPGYTICSRSYT